MQVKGVPHPPELFAEGSALFAAVEALCTGGGGNNGDASNTDQGGVAVALSGSLPVGAPTDTYAALVRVQCPFNTSAMWSQTCRALLLQ